MAAIRNPKSANLKKAHCASTKRPAATKSVNAKGSEIEIAGTPHKRGKQIVLSPKKRSSPRGGRSTSQDDESAKLQTGTAPPKRLGTLLAIEDRSIVESLRMRKAPPNTRPSGDDGMGDALSKAQGLPGDGIIVDAPMAAAASTLLYQLQYGGDNSPNRSEASNGKKLSTLDLCDLHLLMTTRTTSLMDLSFQMTKISSLTLTMIRRKSDCDGHSHTRWPSTP